MIPREKSDSPRRRRWRRETLYAYMFLAPILIFFSIFKVFPLLLVTFISFFDWSFIKSSPFVGLANYRTLLDDTFYWLTLKNTLYFIFMVMPVGISLALILALAIDRIMIRGHERLANFFKTIYFLPMVTMLISLCMVWQWLYDPKIGLINFFLTKLGLPAQPFFVSPDQSLPAIVAFMVWRTLGYNMVMLLAGLQSIPAEFYDAARVDGAGEWRVFSRITLPLLSPIILVVASITVINSSQIFDPVYVLSKGGPGFSSSVLVWYIFEKGFLYSQWGYASAISLTLLLIVALMTLVLFKFLGRTVEY